MMSPLLRVDQSMLANCLSVQSSVMSSRLFSKSVKGRTCILEYIITIKMIIFILFYFIFVNVCSAFISKLIVARVLIKLLLVQIVPL